jgi:uncharacterized protein YndB with AHSA1/START domain
MPIMAVTAYAAKGDEERIRDAGAEGYVSKPISVVRFVEAVRALLAAPRPEEPEAETEEPPSPELRVSRRFDAPAERVFDSWLDPAGAGEWLFATPEGEMVRVEIEPWEGGRFEIVERRGGEDVLHAGAWEALERPSRLVFTLAVPKHFEDEGRIEVSIEPENEGACVLTLTQGIAPAWADQIEQIQEGWERILAALAESLDGDRHPGEGRGPVADEARRASRDPGLRRDDGTTDDGGPDGEAQ